VGGAFLQGVLNFKLFQDIIFSGGKQKSPQKGYVLFERTALTNDES